MFTFLLLGSLALGLFIALLGVRGTKDHNNGSKRGWW